MSRATAEKQVLMKPTSASAKPNIFATPVTITRVPIIAVKLLNEINGL